MYCLLSGTPTFDRGALSHGACALRVASGGDFFGVDPGDFVVPAVGANVGVGARRGDHVGVDVDADAFEEVDQADALDHLAGALVLERVLGEEVDHLLAQLDQGLVILVGLQRHERHDHGAHQVADLERALAADQDRRRRRGGAVVWRGFLPFHCFFTSRLRLRSADG